MTFDLSRADTICALATGNAPAALALVRVSGPDADRVRARVFLPRHPPQRVAVATLGDVVDKDGVVDEALCAAFAAGHSYTGEPGFELTLHGGPLVVRAALASLCAAGCRLAEPGEFTLRAVLSGRIGLPEAEAIDDIIGARTDAGMRAAQRLLRGGLTETLDPARNALVDVLAELEARLDFPDEDLGAADLARLAAALDSATGQLRDLQATGSRGDRLRRGARVVLYGPPNAGKSTLMNALLGEERALVHHEPGTTRDVIEAAIELDGVEVTLVDVAGVRALSDPTAVEAQGIARAQVERSRADLVLALVPFDQAGWAVEEDPHALVVRSKCDLASVDDAPGIAVSARTGAGLDVLRSEMSRRIGVGGAAQGEVTMMRERHLRAVKDAIDGAQRARAAMRDCAPHELVASELRRGLGALDRLLGKDVGADVLDAIFSRFCIGK